MLQKEKDSILLLKLCSCRLGIHLNNHPEQVQHQDKHSGGSIKLWTCWSKLMGIVIILTTCLCFCKNILIYIN